MKTPRGHLRPVLHLVVNLLTVHPNLHCTILLAPSISAKCNAELASPALAHIRQGDNPVENRLQCFHVMTPSQSEKDLFGRHPEEEAKEFGENLPRYLLKLFGKDGEVGVEEMKNKFGDLEPTLGIFDVRSRRLFPDKPGQGLLILMYNHRFTVVPILRAEFDRGLDAKPGA